MPNLTAIDVMQKYKNNKKNSLKEYEKLNSLLNFVLRIENITINIKIYL